jgi:hypothetical protein
MGTMKHVQSVIEALDKEIVSRTEKFNAEVTALRKIRSELEGACQHLSLVGDVEMTDNSALHKLAECIIDDTQNEPQDVHQTPQSIGIVNQEIAEAVAKELPNLSSGSVLPCEIGRAAIAYIKSSNEPVRPSNIISYLNMIGLDTDRYTKQIIYNTVCADGGRNVKRIGRGLYVKA